MTKPTPIHCPHCGIGNSMVSATKSMMDERYQVHCGACGSSSGSCTTVEEAVELWNRRQCGQVVNAEIVTHCVMLRAAENLCRIYFGIAESALGGAEVIRLRDEAVNKVIKP